jgi:TatD DNase family protein
MIDTHAHLHLSDFAQDRWHVLARGFALGISAVVEINIRARGWPGVAALVEGDPRLFAALGIHPHEAAGPAVAELERLAQRLPHPKVVAIGETGIDRQRGYAPFEEQLRLFRSHIALARETGLPLVIHCRRAFTEVCSILDAEGRGPWRGVFHCFSGGLPEARAVIGRGFHVGLGGLVTYDPERWLPVLRALPAERILLETDAPYLSPAPDRNRRNEPACLFETAREIARLLEIDPGELERLADENARSLFGITTSAVGRVEAPSGPSAAPHTEG